MNRRLIDDIILDQRGFNVESKAHASQELVVSSLSHFYCPTPVSRIRHSLLIRNDQE